MSIQERQIHQGAAGSAVAAAQLQAVEHLLSRANDGDVEAHFTLGSMYAGGVDGDAMVPQKNQALACVHFRAAAAGGHVEARLAAAKLFATRGIAGLDVDLTQAWKLVRRATQLGSKDAQRIMTSCYLDKGNLERLLAAVQFSSAFPRLQPGTMPGSVKQAPADFPESGFARHPGQEKSYSLERTSWFDQDTFPARPGAYERLHEDVIEFAYWDGHRWSQSGSVAEDVARVPGARAAGASRQHVRWRGLRHSPDMPHVAVAPAPGPLRAELEIDGYVGHHEQGSPQIRQVHVAKTTRARDGGFLTMCGHMARPGQALRLWSDAQGLKIVDGHQPTLCAVCLKLTFELT